MSEILLVHMPCSLNGDWASKGEDMTSCVNLDTKVVCKVTAKCIDDRCGPFYRKREKLLNIQYSNYVKYEFLTKLG